jgi:hypothetical protein
MTAMLTVPAPQAWPWEGMGAAISRQARSDAVAVPEPTLLTCANDPQQASHPLRALFWTKGGERGRIPSRAG